MLLINWTFGIKDVSLWDLPETLMMCAPIFTAHLCLEKGKCFRPRLHFSVQAVRIPLLLPEITSNAQKLVVSRF